MVRTTLALALAAGAVALAAVPAQADSVVCVREPELAGVYTGCTYVDINPLCVTGGGRILGSPYMLAPC